MIIFKDINFSFNNKVVINNFSQRIENQEKVCLIGESGAGKSTLLQSLMGIKIPDSGNIIVDDLEINYSNIQSIRNKTAWVPQEIHLPYKNVEECSKALFSLK